jgi:hypothetical protein
MIRPGRLRHIGLWAHAAIDTRMYLRSLMAALPLRLHDRLEVAFWLSAEPEWTGTLSNNLELDAVRTLTHERLEKLSRPGSSHRLALP